MSETPGNDQGVRSRTRLGEARARLATLVRGIDTTVELPPDQALGSVAAAPPLATRDVPPEDRAATDGFAVRAADTFEASDRLPARLQLTDGPVTAGTAVRVDAGTPIPSGATAVIDAAQAALRQEGVDLFSSVPEGVGIRSAGSTLAEGTPVVPAGRPLAVADLGRLAAAGVESVTVRPAPVVGIVPTGEGLVPADSTPGPGEAVETNSRVVARLVEQWGGNPHRYDLIADREDFREVVRESSDDLLLTIGGTGRGTDDWTLDAVRNEGTVAEFGLAISPGRTAALSTVENTPIISVPGAPVDCLVATATLLRVGIREALGLEGSRPRGYPATLAGKVPSEPGIRTFTPVGLASAFTEPDDASSGNHHSRTEALVDPDLIATPGEEEARKAVLGDGWVSVPESSEGLAAGKPVFVQQWR